ncbi:MAG: hypothetical protein GYA55_08285, partial [SAR324 cluster bacterium]|nr:hypothetical protein [SAR324 cluster bacterium]
HFLMVLARALGSFALRTIGSSQISALTLLNQAKTGPSYTELGFGTIAAGLAVVGFSFGTGGSGNSSSVSSKLLDSSSVISAPPTQQQAPQLGGTSATNGRGVYFVGNKVIPMSPFM